jgi:tetratricopeptide (TPR) repeat protein
LAWFNKGNALDSLERYQEAIECFDKAIEIDAKDVFAYAWNNKGNALYDSQKYEDAIKCYDKALEVNKNLLEAQINKGNALYNLGEYKDSIKCYNKLLEVKESEDDANDDAYFYRGLSNYALEDYTEALENFNKVSDQFHFRAEKAMSIGQCNYELGFYEDAENNYREAIKSNPKLYQAYYNLAVLYASENKYDRAKRQLETCKKINRNFPDAREAIKKMEGSGQSDWYGWWFGDSDKDKMDKGENNKSKKKISFKPVLGAMVMASIALIIILTIVLAFMYPSNLAASVVAGLTFAMAILIGVLLLPSLRRFKAAGIELEPSPFVPETIKLRPSSLVLEKSIRKLSSEMATADERKK